MHYLKIINTFVKICISWSKLSEKLKNGMKLLVSPVVLELLFYTFIVLFWSITQRPELHGLQVSQTNCFRVLILFLQKIFGNFEIVHKHSQFWFGCPKLELFKSSQGVPIKQFILLILQIYYKPKIHPFHSSELGKADISNRSMVSTIQNISVFVPAFKARTRINFYIQSEDILTKRGQNFSPCFVTRCTVLTLP